MHDALAFSYAPDTIVEDVDDSPLQRRFPRGRVDTGDLEVHVRDDDDEWHRLHPTKLITACGLSITNWKAGNTRAGLHAQHPLAQCECWTTIEWGDANDAHLRAYGVPYEPNKKHK